MIPTRLSDNFEHLLSAKPLQPFDDGVLDFFGDLSRTLVRVKDHSDVATFGFWCRKAALLKEKARYDDLALRIGKGIVFHSTPSNVPVNFAFSFAAGLLAGNANIVRLPGRDFEQVDIIVHAVQELLAGKHADLSPYLCFVKYPPNREWHDKYSIACDVRIIWGGDGTINELRQSPLKPRATEICFADRYSIAVIHADSYLKAENESAIAQAFYNDTYFSDQNACTAPRIVFWLGKNREAAKARFWENLRAFVKKKYELAPVQSVGKLAAFYKAAANIPVTLVDAGDSFVTRVAVERLDEDIMRFRHHSGFFLEYDIDALEDMLPICGERLQTLAYFGLGKEELIAFLVKHRPKGIDRAVPLGRTMDFSLVWDGNDLIRMLSRKVMVSEEGTLAAQRIPL